MTAWELCLASLRHDKLKAHMNANIQICHPEGTTSVSGAPLLLVGDITSGSSATAPLNSSQYHRGSIPTRSSPPSTSLTSTSSSRTAETPVFGMNLMRQTSSCEPPLIVFLRKDRNWSPHARQTLGSQAPGFPLTRRGIRTVWKICVVVK